MADNVADDFTLKIHVQGLNWQKRELFKFPKTANIGEGINDLIQDTDDCLFSYVTLLE